MDYKDYNDNELLMYMCEGNEDASDILYKKYEPIINNLALKISRNHLYVGIDYNDLRQEGFLALYNAINRYMDKQNVCFYTFATTCIERKMISLVNRVHSNKHKALNDALSYDIESEDSYKTEGWFADNRSNPELIITENIYNKNLMNIISENLNEYEMNVINLRLRGLSYKEIATNLGKSGKSIDNTLQRLRRKLKKIFKNNCIIDI